MDKNSEEYKKLSHDRLFKILSTKLTTTFIGALDDFEKKFGDIIERDDCKDDWLDVRNNILSRGNAQIRAIKKELGQYDIKWNRYQYDFKVGDKS